MLFSCLNKNVIPDNTRKSSLFRYRDRLSISPPKKIVDGLLFSVCLNKSGFLFAYLTNEKIIKSAILKIKAKDLELIEKKQIFEYEKEDDVVYLDVFSYKKNFYIAHLERYSYKISLTSYLNSGKISRFQLGNTKTKPYIFIDQEFIKCFYIDKDSSSIFYKEWNLLKNKKVKELEGKKEISSFNVYYDNDSKNISTVWKTKENDKLVCVSPMNKNLYGLSPIIALKFNQDIELPKCIIDENKMNLIFMSDYQYKYVIYPFSTNFEEKNIKNLEKITDTMSDYKIIDYIYIDYTNILVLKKTTKINENQKKILIEFVLFDDNFQYFYSFPIQGIKGDVSNFKYIKYKNQIYIFWLEKIDNESMIKYSILDF